VISEVSPMISNMYLEHRQPRKYSKSKQVLYRSTHCWCFKCMFDITVLDLEYLLALQCSTIWDVWHQQWNLKEHLLLCILFF